MASTSRTAKSLKNSIIALVFYIINLGIQFFSRKIFLEYLGTEILGLNTTAMNLLQFLNLAELGINSAVGFTLYKPLHDNDTQTINEIVTLQGHLYRRIAYFVIGGAILLMCFFPIIFKKISLPLWYAYGSFGVLLFSALLGYFFNYRQIALSASQQDYKILYSYKSVMIIKVAFQMFGVAYLPNGYVWWLIFEALFAIIATLTLTWMTNHTFPYLKDTAHSFYELRKKYSELEAKVKQLIFHKIAGFALTQSSPFIIYAYTNLTVVALYGNYLIVINGINLLVSSIFNSFNAGIGNLIAEADNEKIFSVFEELFSLRFLIVTAICFTTYCEIQSFIKLWIGPDFLLQNHTVIILELLLYISLSRYSIDSFISGFGLYNDILAPVLEAILNIGFSILLGYKWGLDGILSGVLISQIIIVKLWKPYFLFKYGLNGYLPKYIILIIKDALCCLLSFTISIGIISALKFTIDNQIVSFIIHTCVSFICFAGLMLISMVIARSSIIHFFKRLKALNNSK